MPTPPEPQDLAERYTVRLPLFEGPLDLLLHLIQKNELDITAISLAAVADQFVEHIHGLELIDPGVIAEFLVVAAKLLVIKSRLLLPRPAAIEEEEEDPGEALARRLREYKRVKEAALLLSEMEGRQKRLFVRVAPPPDLETRIDWGAMTIDDLIGALQQLAIVEPELEPVSGVVSARKVTVGEKMGWIEKLLQSHQAVPFRRIVGRSVTRVDIVVSLWAVLEMIKRRRVSATQSELFGDIIIYPLDEAAAIEDEE